MFGLGCKHPLNHGGHAARGSDSWIQGSVLKMIYNNTSKFLLQTWWWLQRDSLKLSPCKIANFVPVVTISGT